MLGHVSDLLHLVAHDKTDVYLRLKVVIIIFLRFLGFVQFAIVTLMFYNSSLLCQKWRL